MEACEFRKQMAVNRTLMPFGKIMPNIDWAEPVIVPDEAEVAKVSPQQSCPGTDKSSCLSPYLNQTQIQIHMRVRRILVLSIILADPMTF